MWLLARATGVVVALLILTERHAQADLAPKWSDAELVAFSDIVLTGRVQAIATGWDDGAIYTYVTLDVGDVIKGWIPERQIVLKQIGGRVDDLALIVGGQAAFTVGEEILAFLEIRPRDRTLSTTALWQGKWTIRVDPASGQRIATRRTPGAADRQAFGVAQDTQLLGTFFQMRGPAGAGTPAAGRTETLVVSPPEVKSARAVQEVDAAALMNGAWRQEIQERVPVPLDLLRAAQAGVIDGALDVMIRVARELADTTGITFADGRLRADCFTRFLGTGGISVGHGDPCGEMSPRGGTLAISGAWVNTETARQAEGRTFMQILQAGVMTNAGETASGYLSKPQCFEQVLSHELTHAMVVGTLTDQNASAFLNGECRNGATRAAGMALSSFDTRGSVRAAVAAGSTFTLAWDAPGGSPPSTYVIEAGSAPGQRDLANFVTGGTGTSYTASGVGPGMYYLRVRAANSGGTSPPSNEISVTVGGGGSAPGPPIGLASSTNGSTVTLTWTAPAGPTVSGYVIEAGSTPGQSNLANFATGSTATTFSAAGVGAGTYFVRVRAQNGGGVGASSNEVLVAVLAGFVGCTAAPTGPSDLKVSASGLTVNLIWNAGGGSMSSYIVQAGSSAGSADLADFDTGNPSTTLRATGVGSGSYYVRVRGKNACGVSAPSNEVLLQVK